MTVLPPEERARLDAYARTMRTLMLSLFLVALFGNLIPRTEEELPTAPVGVHTHP